jgi:hypothetical protein
MRCRAATGAKPTNPANPIAVPVALFEIVLLPFWLLFRGFQMPEATAAHHGGS